MQLLLLLLHAMELLGAMSAYISPQHKDALVLILWISLSLMHTFLIPSLRRGSVQLSTTDLSGGGVTAGTSGS